MQLIMKNFFSHIRKLLVTNPFYFPIMMLFLLLIYSDFAGYTSFHNSIGVPFILLGILIYIPFAIILCGGVSPIFSYFGLHDGFRKYAIYCSDLTAPGLGLFLLIFLIEYSFIYITIKGLIRNFTSPQSRK